MQPFPPIICLMFKDQLVTDLVLVKLIWLN